MADTATPAPATPAGAPPAAARVPPTLLLAAEDPRRLAAELDRWIPALWDGRAEPPPLTEAPAGGPSRLAIVDVNPRRLELAAKVVARSEPWRGRNGVWFEPHGLLRDGGRVAFLFPGVEAVFEPRLDDVARHFGLEALAGPLRARAADGLPALERQSRGIIAVGRLLVRVLERLGVVPDMVAGHSLGEWSGLLAAGFVPDHLIDAFVEELRPGAVEVADVTYLALGCGADTARELVAGLPRTAVSHDNCPNQSVVCGPPAEIATVGARAQTRTLVAQELPFRSGFHTPLFERHMPAFRAAFASLPFEAPTLPLWSATTCRPFPPDPGAARALAERHLVEPVRFRELVLALHDAGARVFVQMGVGTLAGFVDQTLEGRDAVAVAANSPRRPGLGQLTQVAAALWVEGREVALDGLAAPAPARTAAWTPAGSGRPAPRTWTRRFALDVEPAWADHALFRQRPGWPHEEDRFPLVPMAGMVEILAEAAASLHPGLVPVAVEDVAAFRWLVVEPPTEATVRAVPLGGPPGDARVRVTIDGHAGATVVLAPDYPEPSAEARPAPLVGERPSPIEASRFYTDRHMFHGPAYHGVERFLGVADNGSRAVLRATAAPGALLDAASQLMGHWLLAHADVDRLVFPTSIRRLELFGPHPAAGTPVECTVTIRRVDDVSFAADMALLVDGRPWCRIVDWEDRRFTTDKSVFDTLQWPERHAMAEARGGYTLVWERWTDSATRDLIMRRYLGRDERRRYERHHPLAQRQLLLRRMAAKDAVRHWLWAHGHGPLYPAEIAVGEDPFGRPVVRGPYAADLRVSVAAVDGVGVAAVGEGVEAGIDVEAVEPRRPEFERRALTPGERDVDPPDGYGRDAWLTALWAVKEAAARADGRRLDGRPPDFEITERRGEAVRVGDRWIAFERIAGPTRRRGENRKEHVVAWTRTDH